MPRYTYMCQVCREMFDVTHAVTEAIEDCSVCGEKNCVEKYLGTPFKKRSVVPKNFKAKPGTIVNENIDEAKRELKEEKKKLRSRHD